MNDQTLFLSSFDMFHAGQPPMGPFSSGPGPPSEPGSPLRRKNSVGAGPYLNYGANSSTASSIDGYGYGLYAQRRLLPPGTYTYRGGRRFHGDVLGIPYPLPCDAKEMARQSLVHLMYQSVVGGLFSAPFESFVSDGSGDFAGHRLKGKGSLRGAKSREPVASGRLKLPSKVLDVGCGAGLWSSCAADEFRRRGKTDVKFVGLDVVPLVYPDDDKDDGGYSNPSSSSHSLVKSYSSTNESALGGKRTRKNSKTTPYQDKSPSPSNSQKSREFTSICADFDFEFVRHNMIGNPLPFRDGEFDYVFARDTTLCVPNSFEFGESTFIQELLRVLKHGGVLEIQCSDFTLRKLSSPPTQAAKPKSSLAIASSVTTASGAYPVTASSSNSFSSAGVCPEVAHWNRIVTQTFQGRGLNPSPCALVGPALLGETLTAGSWTSSEDSGAEDDIGLPLRRTHSGDLLSRGGEKSRLSEVTSKRWAVPVGMCPWEATQEEADRIAKERQSEVDALSGRGPMRPSMGRKVSVELMSPGPPPNSPPPPIPTTAQSNGSIGKRKNITRKGSGSLQRAPSTSSRASTAQASPEPETSSNRFSILLPIQPPPGQIPPILIDPHTAPLSPDPTSLLFAPLSPMPPLSASQSPSTPTSAFGSAMAPSSSLHSAISRSPSQAPLAVLTENQLALRHVAKQLLSQTLESLEVAVRDAAAAEGSPIHPDEWDKCYRELMIRLYGDSTATIGDKDSGSSAEAPPDKASAGGECLEFGAWWGIKA